MAARRHPEEATSGDVAVVSVLPEGALVAVIDGLGHGREAARAARSAAAVVRETVSPDLVVVLRRCHAALQGTRGAAISLAFVSVAGRRVTWVGVGSVEGRVVSGGPSSRPPKGSLALATGLPGHELPSVRTATLEVSPGDVIILATDGVDPAFADSLDVTGSTQAISERIVADHGNRPDDALAVAVRYLGVQP